MQTLSLCSGSSYLYQFFFLNAKLSICLFSFVNCIRTVSPCFTSKYYFRTCEWTTRTWKLSEPCWTELVWTPPAPPVRTATSEARFPSARSTASRIPWWRWRWRSDYSLPLCLRKLKQQMLYCLIFRWAFHYMSYVPVSVQKQKYYIFN